LPDFRIEDAYARPTTQQVLDFARSIGFEVDPEKFIQHYDDANWQTQSGSRVQWRRKLRDWKARFEAAALKAKKEAEDHLALRKAETIATLKAQGRYNDKQS
jgi:hypothetical protein